MVAQLPISPSIAAWPGLALIRPDAPIVGPQRLLSYVGISAATVGARALSLSLVVVPPGAIAHAHRHRGYETAIYCLQGRVETRFGPGLRMRVVSQPGDFLYIDADMPHQPRNLSTTEPALALVARSIADEQELVVPYGPADA